MGWEERYRNDIREFLETPGTLTVIDMYRYWGEEKPKIMDDQVSPYGYTDFKATSHLRKCGVASLEGAEVYEKTYSMFAGTFVDNENEVGINVKYVSCQCGEVKGRFGRWAGSFAELINKITGGPKEQGHLKL